MASGSRSGRLTRQIRHVRRITRSISLKFRHINISMNRITLLSAAALSITVEIFQVEEVRQVQGILVVCVCVTWVSILVFIFQPRRVPSQLVYTSIYPKSYIRCVCKNERHFGLLGNLKIMSANAIFVKMVHPSCLSGLFLFDIIRRSSSNGTF